MSDATTPDLPRIVQVGHPVLRAAAEPVAEHALRTPEFRALVDTMVAVMRAAPGVGLAAPQIGVSRQLIVVEDPEERLSRADPERLALRGRVPLPLTVIVNPTLRLLGGPPVTFLEGCLSVTGYMALVARAPEVEVAGLDATGLEPTPRVWRLRGWSARILQHEVDHLRGTLYVDRMHARSLCGPEEAGRWADSTTEQMAAGLGVDLA
jgi:peptide deformylase